MSLKLPWAFLLMAGTACFGNTIFLPGGTLTIPATSTAGVSFTYSGTLTDADTLALVQTQNPCLQLDPNANPEYCVNGAGVVTTAGIGAGVGGDESFTGTFGGVTGTWIYGALLIEISGEGTEPVFIANAANGLGSSTPPLSLNLASTSLSGLGFSPFSALNPTITFIMADTIYGDNSGQFVLTQTPEPATISLMGGALVGLAMLGRRARSRR
jgi:hypothetical protein